MTDKQIKEGIDVSQCECYSVENNSCNDTLSGSCMKEKSQICRLLQTIKAKEQECEELKAEIKLSKEMLIQNTSETNKYTIPQIIEQFISDNYIDQQNEDGYTIPVFIQIENILDIKEDLEQQLDQLKAENEELKKEIAFGNNGTLSDKIRAIVFKDLNKENNKLKQTLTEIKEIAEKSCCLQPTSTCEEYENCKECSRISDDEIVKQILQKISECEVLNDSSNG